MNILDLQQRDSFSLYSAHSVQCWFISLASICSCTDKSMAGEELFCVHPYNCSYTCVITLFSPRLMLSFNTNALYCLERLRIFDQIILTDRHRTLFQKLSHHHISDCKLVTNSFFFLNLSWWYWSVVTCLLPMHFYLFVWKSGNKLTSLG